MLIVSFRYSRNVYSIMLLILISLKGLTYFGIVRPFCFSYLWVIKKVIKEILNIYKVLLIFGFCCLPIIIMGITENGIWLWMFLFTLPVSIGFYLAVYPDF